MIEADMISVIIPVYNVEKYLDECISSIIHQSYSNIEIILIDDGSTDSSPDICDRYSLIDKRIKVIHKVNRGLSDARNVGVKESCGEYIFFIDSDDYISMQTFELLMEVINRTDADLVSFIFSTNDIIENIDKDQIEYTFISRDEALTSIGVTAWCKLYKRECLLGIDFPVGRIHEDEFIFHEVLWQCDKIVSTQYPFYYYRQRDDSIMHTLTCKNVVDAFDAYIERMEFAQENRWANCNKPTISAANAYATAIYETCRINQKIIAKKAISLIRGFNLKYGRHGLNFRYYIFFISPYIYCLCKKMFKRIVCDKSNVSK